MASDVRQIELKKIQPNRLNPRLEFSKAGLDELAESIEEVGVIEPIIVRTINNGYEVVVGERRYRAAFQAGEDTIPAIVRDYTDGQVLELNLIENIQREDLSAVEKGRLCKQLMERFPKEYPTQEAIGKRIGISNKRISEWLQTTELPEEIQRKISPVGVPRRGMPKGKIDYATAVEVSRKVKEPEKAIEIVEKLAEKRIPKRLAYQVIKEIKAKPEKPIEDVFREKIDEAPIYLPFSKHHADAILAGIKTQTSRKSKEPRLKEGMIVRGQITHFADLEITEVQRKRLRDFDEQDTQREGGYTLTEFKEVWKELHGEWNPDEPVYVIRFRLAGVVGKHNSSGERSL